MNELRECFDCHHTWQKSVSTSNTDLPRCPICGSHSVKTYDDEPALSME